MMDTSSLPRRWHTVFDLDTKTAFICREDHSVVASLPKGDDDSTTVEEARLLAAAPVLLNTCYYVLSMLKEEGGHEDEIQELDGAILIAKRGDPSR